VPTYQLKINGETKTVEAPADMPLVWVLRDLLGMTGTKVSCQIAQCRACTVLIDGVENFSCQMRVADVGSSAITTIEGLATMKDGEETLSVVQEVWVREDVPQCGFCQPGQIVTATALLSRNKNPSDADIDAAMSGNICRCGTYNRIRKAIHSAAKELRAGK
jgi:isoquinoline 1-oxidoreductase alpha subunit